MSIERTDAIKFHEKGTLEAVTRWIASHSDGMAEWFKNVRRQYQVDRGNVENEHRSAILLLQDSDENLRARIGVLDVGGATLEDVTAWRTWQDPEASGRRSSLAEEETQGNGGKAYMYRLFEGPTRLLGISDGHKNCVGFEGLPGTVERGTPGWVPSVHEGREVEISSLDGELSEALKPYRLTIEDLPGPIRKAIHARNAFTLVEGQDPTGQYKGRIDADSFISNVVRHEQSTLCLEQVDFYVAHNGRLVNDGKPLQLPAITPYQGFESPVIHSIPDQLPLENGEMVSTTEGGTRDAGRLILHTSAENMQAAWKNLRPRWQIAYRTRFQMVGAKGLNEIVGAMPGSQYVYGTAELPALEPAYVEHGRRRPKPGPLTEALDRFIAEKIRELAQQINARRQEKLDDRALDEVHEENRKLDELKNEFLPGSDDATYGPGSSDGPGESGGSGTGNGGSSTVWGTTPEEIVYSVPETGIHIGKGIKLPLKIFLGLRIRDSLGRPVRASLEWFTSDRKIASVEKDGILLSHDRGTCEIWVKVKGHDIESERIPVRVWSVDHVLLTPRTVDIPVGEQQQVIAEVTGDDGDRSTNVILDWKHDADDQLTVRISKQGVITGNRIGRTAVTAGANGVWARIPIEVTVVAGLEGPKRGSGFPRLLLTDRDIDPATGSVRSGDPDQPPLWQEATDFMHNVWWLNLQSPEAAFAFRERGTSPMVWRTYHAERLIDMVVQVWMTTEFTSKGESQRPEFWSAHLAAMDRHRVRLVPRMWKRLEPYVSQSRIMSDDLGVSEYDTGN